MDRLVVTLNYSLTLTLLAVLAMPSKASHSHFNKDSFCQRSTRYGFCSHEYLPGDNPSGAQVKLLAGFSETLKNHYVITGCYYVHVTEPEAVGYGYFSCEKTDCEKCYTSLANRMMNECTGRAGGIFSSRNCCLRYEVYDICGGPGH